MDKNRKLMICLIVFSIIVIIVGLILFFFTNQSEGDSDKQNSDPDEILNLSCYRCSREQLAKDTYTIDYIYEFCYKDNELNYGNYLYVYTFNNLDSYHAFQFKESEQFNPIDVKEDEDRLTRTYTFDLSYPTEGKTIESYLETLQGWGYTCNER